MSSDTSSHSITRWLERLKNNGDADAARALWERFVGRMLAVARQHLRAAPAATAVADEEDVVVVAFERFLAGVRAGRFPRLNDREDLWAVLFTLTQRQAIRQARDQRRDKRGGGDVRGDSALVGEPMDDAPTPEEEAILRETLARLLAALGEVDEELRQIALARMEGYSNAEIARQIRRSEVTVERRLRLIRETWRSLDAAADG